MYVIAKYTVWEKAFIKNEDLTKEQVIHLLDEGGMDRLRDETEFEYEVDYETMEEMSIEENDGQVTVEFWPQDEVSYNKGQLTTAKAAWDNEQTRKVPAGEET